MDEMNIHTVRSIQTYIELSTLADLKKHIISQGSSSPIIGVTQDAPLGMYKLSGDNVMLDWKVVMNLMMKTELKLNRDIQKKSYTGKEVISMILPEKLNYIDKKLSIKNGNIINGVVIGKHIGANKNSLVHKIWNLYDPETTRAFIDDVQRMSLRWLMNCGFTISYGDTFIEDDVKDKITKIIESKRKEIDHLITDNLNNPNLIDDELFEKIILGELDALREESITDLVYNNVKDKANGFVDAINSGSKGGPDNVGQMLGALGQQKSEGNRIKNKYNNRTLPCFFQGDNRMESKGFCNNSFVKGLNVYEFFFHTIGGREGIIDTAVKTASTGYIQRKLVKALEDISMRYDLTLRNANEIIVQYLYGDSNIKTEKQVEQKIDMLKLDNKSIREQYVYTDEELKNFKTFTNEINERMFIEFLKFRDELRLIGTKSKLNYFEITEDYYSPIDLDQIIESNKNKKQQQNENVVEPLYVIKELNALLRSKDLELILSYESFQNNVQTLKFKDNEIVKTMFKFLLYDKLCPKKCTHKLKLTQNDFDNIINDIKYYYKRAIIQPGEHCGIIAAQSIGEPTTQFTLNTFHKAGTSKGIQGLERLEEIFRFADKIKTPITNVFLKDKYNNITEAQKIGSNLIYANLNDICANIYINLDNEPFQIPDNMNKTFMENDNITTDNIFYTNDTNNVFFTPWLLRIYLNKEKMFLHNLTLLDIKMAIKENYEYYNKEIRNIKKDDKTLINKITHFMILSNQDNDEKPCIHIRFDIAENINLNLLINIKNIIVNNFDIKGIKNIESFVISNKKVKNYKTNDGSIQEIEKQYISFSGSNLKNMFYIKNIEHNTIKCNDIIEVYNIYGIEAARNVIMNDISDNFGDKVVLQHISVLVDMMINTGHLTKINRFGINRLNTDILAKITFEESVEQLIDAAIFSEKDYLRSFSSRIMLGKTINAGTGICEAMIDIEELESLNIEDDVVESKIVVKSNNIVSNMLKKNKK